MTIHTPDLDASAILAVTNGEREIFTRNRCILIANTVACMREREGKGEAARAARMVAALLGEMPLLGDEIDGCLAA